LALLRLGRIGLARIASGPWVALLPPARPHPNHPNRSSTMAPKKPIKDLKKGVNNKKASNIKGGMKKKASSR
jgi:hypothetical protein